MLTPRRLNMSLSPLGLLLDPHRLRIHPQNPSPALEQPLIDIRRPLESEVPRSQHTRAVQPDHVPRLHTRHMERQSQVVAFCHQVRLCV